MIFEKAKEAFIKNSDTKLLRKWYKNHRDCDMEVIRLTTDRLKTVPGRSKQQQDLLKLGAILAQNIFGSSTKDPDFIDLEKTARAILQLLQPSETYFVPSFYAATIIIAFTSGRICDSNIPKLLPEIVSRALTTENGKHLFRYLFFLPRVIASEPQRMTGELFSKLVFLLKKYRAVPEPVLLLELWRCADVIVLTAARNEIPDSEAQLVWLLDFGLETLQKYRDASALKYTALTVMESLTNTSTDADEAAMNNLVLMNELNAIASDTKTDGMICSTALRVFRESICNANFHQLVQTVPIFWKTVLTTPDRFNTDLFRAPVRIIETISSIARYYDTRSLHAFFEWMTAESGEEEGFEDTLVLSHSIDSPYPSWFFPHIFSRY